MLHELYAPSLALLTDLYQLTMGYGYWRNRIHHRRAAFHLFFRTCPFQGEYAIAAGLEPVVQWLTGFEVSSEDVAYLSTLTGNDSKPLFSADFLKAIDGMRLTVDIDSMPEGSLVFANQPILRVTGPLWQCQWIETALLNLVNFQTLIATKASRVCEAARGERVLEFGLRRAQGIDGALSASRAAHLGGCSATSNVLAGRLLGIPVRGTHAHSWVMSFDDELSSFNAYADALPNNCVFLVDTYDTLDGVRNAIQVAQRLRRDGHEMLGIRLDSGDLAELSIAARQLLDEAGFEDASIVASNDLDELEILRLKKAGAKIAVWGVGTNLVTARDQPALGGVYKLGAIEDDSGEWQPRIKLSELAIKTSTPGIQQVRRYFRDGKMLGDVIWSELLGEPKADASVIDGADSYEDLLRPVLREGRLVTAIPSLMKARDYAQQCLEQLGPPTKRLVDPRVYPVMLDAKLAEQKQQMIDASSNGTG
ncbi:MAG: nicotinate phosphoribosyltransferase [Rubripirellula sp.]